MKSIYSRKDFLKLFFITSLASILPTTLKTYQLEKEGSQTHPNILLILLDSLSARNISFYGYQRETMPNLAKFASKSTIYHQHHSTGNFTSTSTASLLTGTYPWTHRAFNLFGSMRTYFKDKNFYSILSETHTTFGYTQNLLAEVLLSQNNEWLKFHPPLDDYSLLYERLTTFNHDIRLSFWGERISRGEYLSVKPTLYLGTLIDIIQEMVLKKRTNDLQVSNPQKKIIKTGMGLSFTLPDLFNWLETKIADLPLPFIAYAHLFPPHRPYIPSDDFKNHFNDGWLPLQKPKHIFKNSNSREINLNHRIDYDQYIANVDTELIFFLDKLNHSGLMDNTYIIITSDHGESFERLIWGHNTEVLYEPLIHIPLIIRGPGQKSGKNIYTPTSSVDLLSTICKISGQPIPTWTEGEVLPNFRDTPNNPKRPIFSLEAKENSKYRPLTIGTMVMIKWPYKLIHYFGYEELPYHFELFNLEEDPEEMVDLYLPNSSISLLLKDELLTKLEEVNKPFYENS